VWVGIIFGALDDAVTLVFGQGAQECNEAAPDGGGQVEVWPVEHLDYSRRARECVQ
jgi:hypothetical protein